jgi:metal-responsive CopG/Arc/MetJ family transcriptional regulator
MKVKTSITLSDGLLKELESYEGGAESRSTLIEQAVREFLQNRAKKAREEKDLKILNAKADSLNEEAEDVLSYQVDF